jgi:CheY-like chemotaxis protein
MSPAVRPRISVINDNPEFLELMSAILEDDAGYDVELHSGEDLSIERLRRARPDLIIVDLLLGGASGWEIVSLARSDVELAGVPIVVCSADVAQLRERAGELERIGNMYVLAKPFGIDQLTELVESLVGGGRSAGVPAAGD